MSDYQGQERMCARCLAIYLLQRRNGSSSGNKPREPLKRFRTHGRGRWLDIHSKKEAYAYAMEQYLSENDNIRGPYFCLPICSGIQVKVRTCQVARLGTKAFPSPEQQNANHSEADFALQFGQPHRASRRRRDVLRNVKESACSTQIVPACGTGDFQCMFAPLKPLPRS